MPIAQNRDTVTHAAPNPPATLPAIVRRIRRQAGAVALDGGAEFRHRQSGARDVADVGDEPGAGDARIGLDVELQCERVGADAESLVLR